MSSTGHGYYCSIRALCFHPAISNGITLHPLFSGVLGGVGAVLGRAVSMKLSILSAAWSCIWSVTWVYVSSVNPAL